MLFAVKATLFVLPWLCSSILANPELHPWGDGPAPAPETALATLKAAEMPPAAATVRTREGALVFHGNLLKDGKRRALIATDRATLASMEAGQWILSQTLEIAPAWIPEGKTSWEAGYYGINPPAPPFTLRDLDGDGNLDLLIAFDHGGESLGYRIAMNRGGRFELLDLISDQWPPEFRSGLLRVYSSNSRGLALWTIEHYYTWRQGKQEPVFALLEDARIMEKPRWILARYREGNLSDMAFEIAAPCGEDLAWRIRQGKWNERTELAAPKDFARLRFKQPDEGGQKNGAYFGQFGYVFRKLSGASDASLFVTHPANLQEFHRSKLRDAPVVEGIPEALKMFGPDLE